MFWISKVWSLVRKGLLWIGPYPFLVFGTSHMALSDPVSSDSLVLCLMLSAFALVFLLLMGLVCYGLILRSFYNIRRYLNYEGGGENV